MTSTNLSIKAADEIARLAGLLNHPLRVRLLHALAAGPGSATVLSAQLGDVSVGDCHYHLKTLKDGGAIKLARSRSVRGATERVYRLVPMKRTTGGAMQLRDFIDAVLPSTISTASARGVVAAVSGETGA